ncbi:hypothetical protein CYY_000293 [Polysphondylium violaceum]|uniref:GATA-type domain-containing protein n=1 Tax=Polysphondylium violaceum TaxID=133409 RepID=A0A8J4Q242_9MYCE|nr:hypothetical protein CYY_000293 [Polysphondylium violaceum]
MNLSNWNNNYFEVTFNQNNYKQMADDPKNNFFGYFNLTQQSNPQYFTYCNNNNHHNESGINNENKNIIYNYNPSILTNNQGTPQSFSHIKSCLPNKGKNHLTEPTIIKRRGRPKLAKPTNCIECNTSETPEWRRRHDGKPLCNRCGIRVIKHFKKIKEAHKKLSIPFLLNEVSH